MFEEETIQESFCVEPYRFEPITSSVYTNSDSDSDESSSDNTGLIPDVNTDRIGNTRWYVYIQMLLFIHNAINC